MIVVSFAAIGNFDAVQDEKPPFAVFTSQAARR
jgi:hypothetical protein